MLNRLFKAFQYRDFRLMWFGACTSSIGTWMQSAAQNWLVNEKAGSFFLGLDSFLGQIPIVLLSLVGGVVADRFDRRLLLVGSQVVQLTCAFSLAALFAMGNLQVWHILSLSFVVGMAQSFGGPAYQALIPTLVDAKDMPNAIALNSIQFNLARVIGPTLGGITLASLGAAWCFSLNGLSFLAVIISLLLLHIRNIPARTGASMLHTMKEGFRFIRSQEGMESLIIIAFLMTFLGIPLLTFLPVVATKVFSGDAKTYTWLLSISGAGAVCGALIVAWLGNVRNKGQIALSMLVALGGLMAGFGLSKSFVFSCVMLFLAGGVLMASFAMISSLVQLIAPDEMRGRVMSVYNVAFRGGMPIGSLISGALVKSLGVGMVLAGNGVLLVCIGLYFLVVHRRVAAL